MYFSSFKKVCQLPLDLRLLSVLEVKATSLTKYLKTLIDLDILEQEVPVTENNPERSKKGLYKIKDNYLKLWAACAAKWGGCPKSSPRDALSCGRIYFFKLSSYSTHSSVSPSGGMSFPALARSILMRIVGMSSGFCAPSPTSTNVPVRMRTI